ncbi:MAG: ATP-binding protein, partial [Desulfobulbaceae bacterium]|nr:ATP-binding protein [Desulfobulbaceae bacterium]
VEGGVYAHSDIFRRPVEKKLPYWGNIDWYQNDSLPHVDVAVPVKILSEDDAVTGVLWGRLSLRGLEPLLARYLPEHGKIALYSDVAGYLLGGDDLRSDFPALEDEVIAELRETEGDHGWLEKKQGKSGAIFIYRKFNHRNLNFILLYYQPDEAIYFLADELRSYNIGLLVCGVFLFVISSYIIIRTVTTPLVTLTEQISELRAEYRPKSEFPRNPSSKLEGDEVEELRNSFFLFRKQLSLYSSERENFQQTLQNQVVEKTSELRKLNDALEHSNMQLQADITKRRQVELQLEEHQRNLERKVQERTIELSQANKTLVEQMLEREKIREELYRVKKLESVGILAGGIAHDFNNILVAIMGNVSLALRFVDKGSQVHDLLEEAQRGSRRASELTRQLLTFSRGGDPVKKASHILDVIRECTEFILRGSSIKSRYQVEDGLWPAEVDSGQISQVIQNMILNARQAMDGHGTITIYCCNFSKHSDSTLPIDDGNYVHIAITDEGSGVDETILDKIFDPYVTTKNEGSGLGLSICHSIVKKHGGCITVSSVRGEGTTFEIYLPAAENSEVAKREAIPQVMERSISSQRILVMDDDDLVRKIAQAILEQFGYKVSLAEDGAEAIRIYKENYGTNESVSLVIMDLTIPGGMGGKEAAREILQWDPGAKIIVSSGYSNAPVMAGYREHGFCGIIHKPFQVEDFISVVQQALPVES